MKVVSTYESFKQFVDQGKAETRKGFGEGAYELILSNPDVRVLTADLGGSLRIDRIMKEMPGNFIQCGVAEANMIGVAAGLTIGGKIPIATTFANFATGRVYDQIRQSVCYANKGVKICASHCGLSLGEDGATHQILEDIALMRAMPNMSVIVPADFNETKAATLQLDKIDGPVYMRFGRPKVPNFTAPDAPFEFGKAQVLKEGSDVSIFACGHLVWKAIEAGLILEEKGISAELINVHTIKPLDVSCIIESIRKTGCAVTAEEHQLNGGLGDAVCQALSRNFPAPVEMVGVDNQFGESGKPDELLDKYGCSSASVLAAVEKVLQRR